MSPAEVGLRNSVVNTAEDLDSLAAIMVNIGYYVPSDIVQPDWFSWFGRQLGNVSEELNKEAKAGDVP